MPTILYLVRYCWSLHSRFLWILDSDPQHFCLPGCDGYTADRYIAYCDARNYADYEHGALLVRSRSLPRDSTPEMRTSLFLGNSRLRGYWIPSTAATVDWFSRASAQYYLLGFSYYENALFAEELLRKLRPLTPTCLCD